MVKQRYEYYKGSTAIIDNETDEYVEDVVDVLNQKDFNINELLKIKQLQAKQITDLEAKLAESKKLNKRLQQVIDKLRDKEFAGKHLVEAVNAVYEPLYQNKYDEAEQLKQQLAESEKEIASLEVCLLENKNNMKEMQGFKIGEDEYDLTDENARNDLRDYIQEFEKVSKRIYEQKEYAEKILRMSTHEETKEICKLKQQLAEKDEKIATLMEAIDARDKEIEALAIVLNRECDACKPNQTAIAELQKVLEWLNIPFDENGCLKNGEDLENYIDQQIKSLKG